MSDVINCPFCMKKHRKVGVYCSDACRDRAKANHIVLDTAKRLAYTTEEYPKKPKKKRKPS